MFGFIKKIPEMPHNWLDDIGTEDDWRKYVLNLRKWEFLQKVKAVKSLFYKKNYVCDPQYILKYFFPVFLAIILNRVYKDGSNSKPYDCWQLTSWDYRQGYGEWSVMCLDFYPKTFEYNIYQDGENTM